MCKVEQKRWKKIVHRLITKVLRQLFSRLFDVMSIREFMAHCVCNCCLYGLMIIHNYHFPHRWKIEQKKYFYWKINYFCRIMTSTFKFSIFFKPFSPLSNFPAKSYLNWNIFAPKLDWNSNVWAKTHAEKMCQKNVKNTSIEK